MHYGTSTIFQFTWEVPEVAPVCDHDILVDVFFTIESYDEHVRAKIQKMIERK